MSDRPTMYEIRIRGALSERLLGAFPGLQAETQGGETVLTGALADQAALHGVLSEIEALGLELLEVRRRAEAGRPDESDLGDRELGASRL